MTGPVFQVEFSLDGEGLRLGGELDLEGAARLRAALAECFARCSVRVVLDLGDLRFCDCAGLNVLLEAKATADRLGIDLCVKRAHAQVVRLFVLAGVETMLVHSGQCPSPRTV